MRLVFSFCAMLAVLGTLDSAQAFEKFIPMGAGYSSEISTLPAINSDAQAVSSQSDIYETDLYYKQLEDKKRDSYMQRFMFNSETSGSDFSIDY